MNRRWMQKMAVTLLLASSALMAGEPVPKGPAPGLAPTKTVAPIKNTTPLTDRQRQALQPRLKAPIPAARECRDPAAQSLTFQVLSRDRDPTKGRVRLTGTIRNLGTVAFVSDPRQVIVSLEQQIPGERRASTLVQRNISNLAAGANLTLVHDLAWDTALEFPATFTLRLSYDPDIYIDANTQNDDCNQNNNTQSLGGEQITRGW